MPQEIVGVQSRRDQLCVRIADFLTESIHLYPNIAEWWQRKILPGLESGERVCRVATVGDRVNALAIGKRSEKSAKLCTLRVRQDARRLGIGQRLLHETLADLLREGCQRVYYTISEQVLGECGRFFTPYDFTLASWEKGRYVNGMDELVFHAEARRLVRTLRKRARRAYREEDAVVLSVKPKYARMIEQGCKMVEFRRRFSAGLAK